MDVSRGVKKTMRMEVDEKDLDSSKNCEKHSRYKLINDKDEDEGDFLVVKHRLAATEVSAADLEEA